MWILIVLAIVVFSALVIGLYQKNTNVIYKSKRRLDGKTALVTGGTAGMGLEIALDFAHRGARVIVACPFVEEGTKARELIVKQTGNDQVVFKLLDLASVVSTRSFAEDILKTEDRLDILMNNAGVGIPKDCLTKDNMNFIMQVNYYGHFLLTLLLLPLLRKTGKPGKPARIVNTASVLHQIGKIDIDRMNSVGYWSLLRIYGNSKLSLVLFSRELTKRLKNTNVVINNVDPGAVGTNIFQSTGNLSGNFISFFFSVFFKNPFEGIQTALYVCLSGKPGEVSGEFFKNCQKNRAIRAAYDDKMCQKMWEESVRLVRLTDDEVNRCLYM